VQYVTPIDARTILFVAPAKDRTGPWLWALDVMTRTTQRVSIGLERYLSVAANANGRRLVASVATPSAALWSVPIVDRLLEERDVAPYPMPTPRALAPRFGKDSLFYLSSSGPGDGLWRLQNGKATEIWRGSDEALMESPSVSPSGDLVALVRRAEGKLRLTLVPADGSGYRSFAETIDVRGTSAWSPDGKWIATGGVDAQGPGLFKIPLSGGEPVRLVTGLATDPVWSPDGSVIVYLGRQVASAPLQAVRPDGTAVPLPHIQIPSAGGGGRFRFLPNSKTVIYVNAPAGENDFSRLDLNTNTIKRMSRLSSPATIGTFDITPDGTRIVFDRLRENADIRLIDLPK
jgi:dipeptidyl aminopeptidase/acylaminoacyl peptidase